MSTYRRANLAVAAFRSRFFSSQIAAQSSSIPDLGPPIHRPSARSICSPPPEFPAKSFFSPSLPSYSVSRQPFSSNLGLGLASCSGFQSVALRSRVVVAAAVSSSSNAPFPGSHGGNRRFCHNGASRDDDDDDDDDVSSMAVWLAWLRLVLRHVANTLVLMGAVPAIYLLINGTWETVPYTKRKHLVISSMESNKATGEHEIQLLKSIDVLQGLILPTSHLDCVRVCSIARDIIEAFKRDAISEEKKKKNKAGCSWHSDVGFDWEILVVDLPSVSTFRLQGGKIVIYKSVLEHFKTDAEIATIIGHEVAHTVARHGEEKRLKDSWPRLVKHCLRLDVAEEVSKFLWYPLFLRMLEKEADHIGLLLMASAGYDPRVAPAVYAKLDDLKWNANLSGILQQQHPCGKERSRLLAQSPVMEEAVTRYMNRELLVSDPGTDDLLASDHEGSSAIDDLLF